MGSGDSWEGGGGTVDPTMVKGVGTQRLGKEITAKVYGSVFFSATETASSPYLVMGLCQKIYRFELIDWL